MDVLKKCCGFLVFAFLAATPARAEVVTLRSGNGSIGGTDSLIHVLIGPADAPFGIPFTPATFAAAQAGPAAFIITPNGAWISGLAGDATTKWIATNAGGASEGSTGLYAIGFTLTQAFSSAALDLHFAVDNQLGAGTSGTDITLGIGPMQGVFLNGTAISGNSIGGGFTTETVLTRTDIAPLLVVGANTLFINATDTGGPAGLIFRATITTVPSGPATAPEPSSLALVSLGSLGLLYCGWRARRRLA